MFNVITSTSRLSFFVHETSRGSNTAIENRNLIIIALIFHKCKNYHQEKVLQKSLFLPHYPFFSQEKFRFIDKREEIRR
jgi:hypothetical protein